MRSTRAFGCSMLVFGCLASFAAAQNPGPATVPPPLVTTPAVSPATFAQPSVVNLDPQGAAPFHLYGDAGVGLYSIHGAAPGAMIGTGGSVNMIGDRLGAGFSWFDGSSSFSKPGAGSISHRP